MKRLFGLFFTFTILVSSLCYGQIPAAAGQAEALETISRLTAEGKFSDALSYLETTGLTQPGSATEQAQQLLSSYLDDTRRAESQRTEELAKAVAQTTNLMEIALLNENSNGKFTDIRDHLSDIRKIIIDLLAAARVEENITAAGWMKIRIADDTLAIKTKLDEIKLLLDPAGELTPKAPQQSDTDIIETAAPSAASAKISHGQIILGAMDDLLKSLEKYAAKAEQHDWSTAKQARESLDKITDTADELAASMDWISALVSEMPWREALDKLLIAKMVAFGDTELLDEPWAVKTVNGADSQARKYADNGKYYKALSLFSLLDTIFTMDNDTRYKRDINRVTRQAVMMSLYAKPDEEEFNKTLDEDSDKTFEEILAEHDRDWRDHIRGVDFNMSSIILARIHDSYVKTPDFTDLLDGAINSIETMMEIPRIEQTFTGLADKEAKAAFAAKLHDLRQQALAAPQLDYRMVAVTLKMILRANSKTVKIPQEVIDIEFTNGALGRLDKFSTMIWPNDWKEFRKQITGNFRGVGIQIQYQRETDYISVISPLENSPAYRAGIQADDLIIKVDGKDAKGLDTNEAVDIITGPAGTKVTLTIKRPGRKEPMDFELTRQEINVQTVKGWKRTEGENWDWMVDRDYNIGYVRITSFTTDTVPGLRNAIAQMKQDKVGAIVLDMRGNPGGMFPAAIGVTDEFVETGTIVSTRGRTPEDSYAAGIPGGFENGPLVVLVDEHSASAAEIVSGALKDLSRAIIVGRRSYGKGSVQNLMPIRPGLIRDDDAHLKLTTAHYYLPSGRCLHRLDGQRIWGVEPDVTVALTPKQNRRWQLMRRRTEIIKDWDFDQLRSDMAKQLQYDRQLQTALLICRMQLLASENVAETAGVAMSAAQ